MIPLVWKVSDGEYTVYVACMRPSEAVAGWESASEDALAYVPLNELSITERVMPEGELLTVELVASDVEERPCPRATISGEEATDG